MPDPIAALAEFVDAHPRLFVLTGAGVSTGSGIPGYRDRDGQWQRRQPVTHQDFLGSEAVRKRYWARSLLGFRVMADAAPNAAHAALAQLERAGRIGHLVTQNVDGLHQRAGSTNLTELHGSIRQVVCMDCGALESRSDVQLRLQAANLPYLAFTAAAAPDGDADLEGADFDTFTLPACACCGGLLKPDVVFYGAGVPRARADAAMAALLQADAVLVAGSSLMVYSGYRFCERADALAKPVAAINLGRTRADALLRLKVEGDCAEVLGALAALYCAAANADASA
jgi:NAD-dependent SIR2 family protein deacetylase